MKTLLKNGLLALCLTAMLPAVPLIENWNFTGTCSDCPDVGSATLTTSTSSNVVSFSFSYNSDWISYTLTAPSVFQNLSPFAGTSFTINPGDRLDIFGIGTLTSFGGPGNPVPAGTTAEQMYFRAFANGNWETGISSNSDFGTNGVWTLQGGSTVPEPSTLGLAGLSASLLAFRIWRQRKA